MNVLEIRQAITYNDKPQREADLYVDDRGLPDGTRYDQRWGTFKGESLSSTITRLINQKGHVDLLDVGTGQGNLLRQAKQTWGYNISCTGFTISPIPNHSSNIQILDQNIETYSAVNQFDVITSHFCFRYLSNPLLALKKVYRALRPGGYAYITTFHPEFNSYYEEDLFRTYLESAYDFEFHSVLGTEISFQKTLPHLALPVQVKNFQVSNTGIFSGTEALYSFLQNP